MRPVLIEIQPLLGIARTTVRAADGPESSVYGANDLAWAPAVAARPVITMELMSPDMDGRVRAARASFTLDLRALAKPNEAARLYWRGAPVTIWAEEVYEGAGAPASFSGFVTGQSVDQDRGTVRIDAEVSTSKLEVSLLSRSFTGAGGIGGEAAKAGVLMPAGFGSVRNIEPVWFDTARNIGMIDGYGNCTGISWLGEGLESFGAAVADYPTYQALADAIDNDQVPRGRWATCIAQGLVGLGAPPVYVITVHATFGANRAGAWMRRLLEAHAGLAPATVDVAAFAALDAAVPRPTHHWTADQVTVRELLEQIAQSCNATFLVTPRSIYSVARAVLSTPVATLDRGGGIEPRVLNWASAEIEPPVFLMKARAARPARVLTTDEVKYDAVLTPRGLYDPNETYRLGDLVQFRGSTWLYTNDTPSSGNEPPENGTENAYWSAFAYAGPGTVTQGSSDYDPANPGAATWGAPDQNSTYLRFSDDGGQNFGPALKITGEGDGPQLIFRRSPSQPATPVGDNIPDGWSDGIPPGTDLIWMSRATQRGGITQGGWTTPGQIKGDPGTSSAEVRIYRRTSSTPALPTQTATYLFGSGFILGLDNGWSSFIDGGDTSVPVWAASANAAATGSSDTIGPGEWSQPTRIVQQGPVGQPGQNTYQLPLYQRSASTPAVPSQTVTYTFSNGTAGGINNGWQRTPPSGSGKLWLTVATARSYTDTDDIAPNEWGAPIEAGANGIDGANSAVLELFIRSNSTPALPSATVTYTFANADAQGINNGWQRGIPSSGPDKIWQTQAQALSNSATDTIPASEWSAPVVVADRGATGADGPPNFTLVNGGNVSIASGRTITKTGGSGSSWDAGAYTAEGFINGATVSMKPNDQVGGYMGGLNSDPASNNDFASLDYAFYWSVDSGKIEIYESGQPRYARSFSGWASFDLFYVQYDGRYVRYYINSDMVREVQAPANLRLFADTSIRSSGRGLSITGFAAAGKAGTDGKDGKDGQNGAGGRSPEVIFIPANGHSGSIDVLVKNGTTIEVRAQLYGYATQQSGNVGVIIDWNNSGGNNWNYWKEGQVYTNANEGYARAQASGVFGNYDGVDKIVSFRTYTYSPAGFQGVSNESYLSA